ncbi:DUF6843 domain-containing protein [Paenibacillus sp. N3.4]|uniref:DUF6843 domain-containing protein n=1 Tax=Paenibacillus sp. N3.4 TaxID=2603222 RepID=UPI0011CB0F48|nr:hypothetical protein [Paenibacillus sp. N3.4]TXK75382.1 hypothetical protein FU659_27585 [Paenibacillus sp. N3.4]
MKKVVIFLILFVTLFGIAGVYTAIKSPEHHKYIVPDGYTGWVKVTFDQAGYPPLEKKYRTYLYAVPANGQLVTSSRMKAGSMQVFYLGNDGSLRETGQYVEESIHAMGSSGHIDKDGRDVTEFSFFLGSKEQWKSEADK